MAEESQSITRHYIAIAIYPHPCNTRYLKVHASALTSTIVVQDRFLSSASPSGGHVQDFGHDSRNFASIKAHSSKDYTHYLEP